MRFAKGGYNQVSRGGGEITQHAPISTFLANVQHSNNVFGAVGEIGVHHGRFTIPLMHTALVGEELLAIDLFEENQKQNVDGSGAGSS